MIKRLTVDVVDSEIDGPPNLSDQDPDEKLRKLSKSNEIFADDPWNALCVLGLRVYTLNSETSIEVIKPEPDHCVGRKKAKSSVEKGNPEP